jgi:hypothetical protein
VYVDYESACRTLLFLAAPFAGHEQYDPAWTVGADG